MIISRKRILTPAWALGLGLAASAFVDPAQASNTGVVISTMAATAGATLNYCVGCGSHSRKEVRDSLGNLYYAHTEMYNGKSRIFVARSTNNGATWANTTVTPVETAGDVPTPNSYDQSEPALAIDSNDVLHLVWAGFNNVLDTVGGVEGKLVYSSAPAPGTAWSPYVKIPANSYEGYEQAMDIVVDGNNGLHIAWQGQDSGTAWAVRYTSRSATSSQWMPYVELNLDSNDEVSPGIVIGRDNAVHVVATQTSGHAGPDISVVYSSRTATGGWTPWSTVANVSPYTIEVGRVSFVMSSTGTLYAAWTSPDVSNADPQAKFSTLPPGGAWSAPANIQPIASTPEHDVHLAIDSSNQVYAVWSSSDAGNAHLNVKASTYTAGAWQPWYNVSNATSTQFMPAVRWTNWRNNGGNLEVAWLDYDDMSLTTATLRIVNYPGVTMSINPPPILGTFSTAPFTAVSASGLTANWGSTFPVGTQFYVYLSSAPNFTGTLGSFITAGTSAVFNSLNLATTYYVEISTLNVSATSTAFFTQLGSTMTLATLSMPAGCGIGKNVKQDGTQDTTTIQAAVNLLPPSLSTTTCVVIRDAGTYNEQVIVQGIANNGYQIKIMSDPSFISSAPVINPPASSTAAFQVLNSSVVIKAISVFPMNAVSFGILASSPSAIVDHVYVNGGANINTAGISVMDNATIVKSSVTGQATFGIKLTGSNATVSNSTANINSAGDAIQILGSNNSINDNVFLNQNGYAGVVMVGASGNSIIRSTFSNAAAINHAIDVNGNNNTLTQIYAYNASWSAAGINNGQFNTISGSTLTTGYSAGNFALSIAGGSSNTVTGSMLLGGLDMNSNTQSNQINQNAISVTVATAYAANWNNTSNNSINQDIFSGGYPMYLTAVANNNAISQSTITTTVAGTPGVYLLNTASNTFTGSYIQGAPALQIVGSTNTTVNSTVIVGLSGTQGLQLTGASMGLSMSSNTVTGSAVGINIGPFTAGSIMLTSNTITASPMGLKFDVNATSANYTLSGLILSGLLPGATAIMFGGNTFVSTFTNVNFEDASMLFNVNAAALSGNSSVVMSQSTGTRSGPCYSVDPLHVVFWPGNNNCPLVGTISTAPFTAVTAGGLTANWASTFPGGTNFFVYLSSVSNFTGSTFSFVTSGNSAAFSGLSPGIAYFAEISTSNVPASSVSYFNQFGSTTTLTVSPPVSGITAPTSSYLNTLGSIQGTAAAFSATISSVGVAIQNLSNLFYWNGATFVSGPAIFSTATFVGGSSGTWTFSTGSLTAALTSGTSYQIQSRATDTSALSQAPPAISSFIFDNTPPVSGITVPATNTVQSTFPAISGTAADNAGLNAGVVSQVQLSISSSPFFNTFWNGSMWVGPPAVFLAGTGTTAWTYSTVPSGLISGTTFQIVSRALDVAGNFQAPYSTSTFLYSTSTGGAGGTITPMPFTAVASNTLTANWNSTFGAGTTYYTQISTGPMPNANFGNQVFTGTTLTATFNGLTASTLYYGGVSTSPAPGTGYALGTVTTLGGGGAGSFVGPFAFTAVTPSSLTVSWGTTFAGGTTFYAFVSTSSLFQGLTFSVTTTNPSAAFGGLNPATLYFAEVSTSNVAPSNFSMFMPLGSTTTPNGAGNLLTVTVAGTGNVLSSPVGINCGNGGTTCAVAFAPNSIITLTAAPSSGATFTGWTGACTSTSTVCNVTMAASLNVNASFTSSGFNLGVGFSGSGLGNITSTPGGITCGNGGSICNYSFPSGSTITLTAVPGGGSTFSGWTGVPGCGVSPGCTVVMNAAQFATAIFNSSSGGGFNLFVSTGGTGVGNVTSAPAGINCGNGGVNCFASYPAR